MRVFVTGATGFIGSAVVKELIAAGHQVIGLCRSDDKAPALGRRRRRSLSRIDRRSGRPQGAARRVRTASSTSRSITISRRFVANCENDRRVIKTLGSVLAGSDRPLIVTSGTAIAKIPPGQQAREDNPRVGSERLPPRRVRRSRRRCRRERGQRLHRAPAAGPRPGPAGPDHARIVITREKGVCAYVGDGRNRWPAAHVLDVARLYRLAIEKAEAEREL